MIKLTKPNKEVFYLNPVLIEKAEANPNTVITLLNNKKYIISETAEELVEILKNYYTLVGMVPPQITVNAYKSIEKASEQLP